jgi:hypothetical protein
MVGQRQKVAKQEGCKCGKDKTVYTVHDAAMTRDEMTGVLGAEAPLDPGFEQIADFDATDRIRAMSGIINPPPWRTIKATPTPAPTPAAAPNTAPDHVLPGDMRGASFGPPRARPQK